MRRKIIMYIILSLYIFVNWTFAQSTFCYPSHQKNIQVTKKDIAIYRTLFPESKIFPDEAIRSLIEKNKILAYEVLKKGPLSKDTQKRLQLVIESTLAQYYMQKWKEEHPPSEDAIRSFYLDHKDSFKPVEHVDISTIMVASLKKADDLYFYLKKHPQDFAKLAQKESIGPAAKRGGKYINVPLSMFHPLIREWIRNHKVGEISPPLQVGSVFYIEKIEKKYKEPVDYKHLAPSIKKLLEDLYLKEKMDEIIEKLKEGKR